MTTGAPGQGDAGAGTPVAVICGPTGAGKSAVAAWLADTSQQRVVIISADSRQIYRGFDTGTAKPSAAERARVPHRGVDVAEPTERYSAARWAAAAGEWIREARRTGALPIVVGGTGLYLRALFEGLYEEPQLDGARRARLSDWLRGIPTDELRRWTSALDPARAHLGRVQLARAVEIALLAGRRVSALHAERATPGLFAPRYLLVDPGPALADRLSERLDGMLAAGWLDEVRTLARHVPPDAPAWQSTGYGTMHRVLTGELDMAQARLEILIHTRQYAKRQRTWFRHQLPTDAMTRLDPLAANWRDTAAEWLFGAVPAGGRSRGGAPAGHHA
jgi:tRNA dimethylallyltransferase